MEQLRVDPVLGAIENRPDLGATLQELSAVLSAQKGNLETKNVEPKTDP